ncbi:Proteinase inhibitor propeptide [Euphorbia peplus]|nr:Proteinase inhibitor propeptide [Euphorbia peplus]
MQRIRNASLCFLILIIFALKIVESTDDIVHIVYTQRPQDEELEVYHLRTLSNLLGSEDAAKESLIYTYNTAACGFSAKLTAEQGHQLSQQPGILQVVPSARHKLHGGSGPRNNVRGPGMRY